MTIEETNFFEQKNNLDCLLKVGRSKPMGYLEVEDLRQGLVFRGQTVKEFLQEIRIQGKEAKIFPVNITERWSRQKFYREKDTYLQSLGKTGYERVMVVFPPEIQSIYTEEIDRFDGLREFLENFVSLRNDEIVSDTQNG